LYVHDSSNQKACCVSVPASSLASTRSLTKFLSKRGFSMPAASLLTVHEDRVPCDLHVVPMASDMPILMSKTLSADCVLHLFVIHDASSDSLLQSFANVHPECFRTLAECAQQPTVTTISGATPVDFQSYLEAAFEASVQSDSILYNDCDKVSLKAEWCIWNTGLLWKDAQEGAGSSGYIFLFFKRSLSRVTKDRLAAFSLDCPRQAKPWTMNKPKLVSDVTQWLNGASVPPPPPAELVASLISRQAAISPISIAKATFDAAVASISSPCTPTMSEKSLGQSSDLACSECSNASDAPSPCPVPTLSRLSLMGRSSSPASTEVSTPTSQQSGRSSPSLGTGDSKAAKHRRRRRRSNPNKAASASGSSTPAQPMAVPKEAAQKEMEAHIDELVTALQQACSTTALQTCGWISSMYDPAAASPSSAIAGSWAGQLDWVL
jgi:hypothetical protein